VSSNISKYKILRSHQKKNNGLEEYTFMAYTLSEYIEWIHLAQDKSSGSEPLVCIEGEKFPDHFSAH
jgi:hypothetical protein